MDPSFATVVQRNRESLKPLENYTRILLPFREMRCKFFGITWQGPFRFSLRVLSVSSSPFMSLCEYLQNSLSSSLLNISRSMYGVFFLMFATFAGESTCLAFCEFDLMASIPELFATTYGFKAGVGGLAYLGLGVGFVLSALVGAKFANQVYLKVRLAVELFIFVSYKSYSWLPRTAALEHRKCASRLSSLGRSSYPSVSCECYRVIKIATGL